MNFPQILSTSLHSITRELGSARSVLFLYDDVADGFVLAATAGGSAPKTLDGFILASDTDLGRVMDEGSLVLQPVDGRLTESFPGLAEHLRSSTALFIPVVHSTEVGVVVASQDGTEMADVLDSPESILGTARDAAQAVSHSRPDIDHTCPFRRILEVDPGGIAIVEGRDAVISYANTEFRTIVQGSVTPFLGRSLHRALTNPVRSGLMHALRQVIETGTTYRDAKFEVRDPFGSRYYELNVVPRETEESVADAAFIVLWDRTDIVSTRMALEESARRVADAHGMLSAVLEGTNNGILLVDRARRILYANERLAALFGVESAGILGKTHDEYIELVKDRLRNPNGFVQRLAHTYRYPEIKSTDDVEVLHPAHRILSRYSGPVYKDDGDLLGRIEVYTDVTEVRQLQRNKDEFLSVVSHELKTPITSIKGYAQLLTRRAADSDLPPSTVMAYTVIERQVNRMQELIGSLLDLSRLDTNKLDFEDAEVNFTRLLRHTVSLVGMADEARVISLQFPEEDIWMRGDERRLEQVVTNLLANAVRYSPGGELVTVTLSCDPDITLRIKDNGIGIPREALALVFDRFYRGPGMTDLTGMGIGLYISKTIVEQHEGTITVESELGVGSTFTVSLPASRRLRQEASREFSSTPPTDAH